MSDRYPVSPAPAQPADQMKLVMWWCEQEQMLRSRLAYQMRAGTFGVQAISETEARLAAAQRECARHMETWLDAWKRGAN